jgi:hypothetical protein
VSQTDFVAYFLKGETGAVGPQGIQGASAI